MAIPFLNRLLIGGTPAADGELGRDATLKALSLYDNGQLGTIPRTLDGGTGTEAFTNSVTSDQDFATLFTIPANTLFTNKILRVLTMLEIVSGVSSVTIAPHLKLGATKVCRSSTTPNWTDSVTQSLVFEFLIFGRAAAGAAADVSCCQLTRFISTGEVNTVNQPVALATNGDLAIALGVAFSGTGGSESAQLQAWLIQEMR